MGKTKIEWTERTWSPVTGCSKISTGCTNCYAERMARRLAGRAGYPEAPNHFDVTTRPDRLDQPLRWKKPSKIFACSMSDLFHEDVPFEFIEDVFTVMVACNGLHTFQVLTKRPERMREFYASYQYLASEQFAKNPYSNIHIGVSVENQQAADERIPILLEIPAVVRFASVEPMLGPVDLDEFVDCRRRPMELEWAVDLVSQCNAASKPVFVKQLPIGGKISHDPDEWPKELRVREYPE
jgi:protein gp37